MKVKNPFAFAKLVSLLAAQAGGLVNLHELSSTIGINFRTIENYLFALENTFVISLARPYFTNARKELTKMPKVYFVDTGMRNLSVKDFSVFADNRDKGQLLENIIASSISRRQEGALNYWRTKDKNEVDFVIRDYFGGIIPVEVKAVEMKGPEIHRGLRSFIDKHQPKKAFIVNLSLQETVKINNTRIKFILPYQITSILS